MCPKHLIKKLIIVVVLIMLIAVVLPFADLQDDAEARVTQAHIDRLREDRRNLQSRMRNVQSQIDAIEFDMLSETVRKGVLQDRIILTGFEIENIVATIEEYEILITDKELQIVESLENEAAHLQLHRERVRSLEERGVITYLEIIFDAASFTDLLARIDFVLDIMRADERIFNDLVEARLATAAAREELLQTREAMEEEYLLLESKEMELLAQVDELDAVILQLEADMEAAGELHRQLSAEDARIQNTINSRVEQLRRQQERDARAAASATWGTAAPTAQQPAAQQPGASHPGTSPSEASQPGTSPPGTSQPGPPQSNESGPATPIDENLRWLAFIIHLEARHESLEGRIAVGNVIMNRVRSPLFPSTVRAVVLDTRDGIQFPPAHRRSIDDITPSAGSMDAARRVLNGETASGIGNSLYFNRSGMSSWAANNRPFIITIGNHDFFG